MRKVVSMVFLVLALLGVVAPLSGQATHTVQPGDTLWGLAGENLDSATAWRDILRANDFLNEPGRVFVQDGRTIVIIRPGERLAGLNRLGITLTSVETPTPAPTTIIEEKKEKDPSTNEVAVLPIFLTMILTAALVALMYSLFLLRWQAREQELNSDPTFGSPVYANGVNPQNISEAFAKQAAWQYNKETGRASHANYFTVLRTVPGRAWGILTVGFKDGSTKRRRLHGEQVWRGHVRFPDGKTEVLYMLQACGNDLRHDGVTRTRPEDNFRFVPDDPTADSSRTILGELAENTKHAEAEAIGFDRDSTPAEPALVPAPITPAITETTEEERVIRIELRPANIDQPEMVRLEGVEEGQPITFERKKGTVTIRFIPRVIDKL